MREHARKQYFGDSEDSLSWSKDYVESNGALRKRRRGRDWWYSGQAAPRQIRKVELQADGKERKEKRSTSFENHLFENVLCGACCVDAIPYNLQATYGERSIEYRETLDMRSVFHVAVTSAFHDTFIFRFPLQLRIDKAALEEALQKAEAAVAEGKRELELQKQRSDEALRQVLLTAAAEKEEYTRKAEDNYATAMQDIKVRRNGCGSCEGLYAFGKSAVKE